MMMKYTPLISEVHVCIGNFLCGQVVLLHQNPTVLHTQSKSQEYVNEVAAYLRNMLLNHQVDVEVY